MEEIKFRQRIGDKFHYWGFIDGGFKAPCVSFKAEMTIEKAQEVSQQYIDTKDKNSVEIYKGDIVRGTGMNKGMIKEVRDVHSFCGWPHVPANQWEVIGNIYEATL